MKRLTSFAALCAALGIVSVALAATTLSGTFKTTIKGKGEGTLNGYLDGTWKITFKDGTYNATVNGKAAVHGEYKLGPPPSGYPSWTGSITLNDKGGPDSCKGTGKYGFTLSGKNLSFFLLSDPKKACEGRVEVLGAHKFKKV